MAITAGSKGDDDLTAALKAFSAGAGGKAATGMVFMGHQRVKQGVDPDTRKPVFGSQSRWLSADEALADFYQWSDRQRADFTAQLVLAGVAPLGSGPLEAEEGWRKLVTTAARYGATGAEVSPYDLLATYVQSAGGSGKDAWTSAGVWQINTQTGERKYAGPGTYLGGGRGQQVDTRVDLTDPDTARAISTKLFQDLMGRDPGEGELTAFANALSTAEQSSPVVATTTTQYDMETGQPISSESTQAGGVTAEGKAYIQEQQLKKKKEYGAYQAATTYQGAFDNLVFGSPE